MLVCARGVGVGEDYSSNFASHLKLSVYQLHAHLVYDIYLCCFSPPPPPPPPFIQLSFICVGRPFGAEKSHPMKTLKIFIVLVSYNSVLNQVN